MVIHGEPPSWREKPKFVGPWLDFEGSLYDDYFLIEPPVNFNHDDDIAKRSEELMREMYAKTLSLLALLKTVKVVRELTFSSKTHLQVSYWMKEILEAFNFSGKTKSRIMNWSTASCLHEEQLIAELTH